VKYSFRCTDINEALKNWTVLYGGLMFLWLFRNRIRFYGEELLTTRPNSKRRTTPCRLSATAYSIYSQLPSILEAVPPSTTWGSAVLWWQGTSNHGEVSCTEFYPNYICIRYGRSPHPAVTVYAWKCSARRRQCAEYSYAHVIVQCRQAVTAVFKISVVRSIFDLRAWIKLHPVFRSGCGPLQTILIYIYWVILSFMVTQWETYFT
jgi:hypothetical protein